MKLTVAKCPNCNAEIEIDENLEKTICHYCRSTILVEETIPKFPTKIKIDGIQSNPEKIEIILNYLKIGETDKAITILNEILEVNPFNEEALSIYIQIQNAILNAINKEFENLNPLASALYNEIDITENIAYEQIEKIQAVAPNKYEDIIKEHYQLFEKTEKLLKKQKITRIILKFGPVILLLLLVFSVFLK